MSQKERDQLRMISALGPGQITQKQAAEQLGLTKRQVGRLLGRYEKEGDAGLIHRARGKPSNRRIDPEVKERVITLLKEHYRDFGPTLAAEKLAGRHGLEFSKETVRRWMIEAGLHKPKPRKVAHLRWRAGQQQRLSTAYDTTRQRPLQPDISILLTTGHFYIAHNRTFLYCSQPDISTLPLQVNGCEILGDVQHGRTNCLTCRTPMTSVLAYEPDLGESRHALWRRNCHC